MKQTIFEFKMNGEDWEIKMTAHSYKRLVERFEDIGEFTIVGDIIALGENKLKKFVDEETDVAIIDENRKLSIIVSFDESSKNWIKIITIIDKKDIFVKDGIEIEKL